MQEVQTALIIMLSLSVQKQIDVVELLVTIQVMLLLDIRQDIRPHITVKLRLVLKQHIIPADQVVGQTL